MMRLFLMLFALYLLPVHAAPVPDRTPDKVGPSSYVIHGPLGRPSPENQGFMNNPGFIITRTGVVVIDPGGSLQIGEMVLRQIRKITKKPVIAVFNTHIHGDHWLGNHAIRNAYPEVPIYGHKKVIERVAAGEGETWRQSMLRLTSGATEGTRVIGPNKSIEGNQDVIIDGVQFNLIYQAQAHSDTDIMIEVPAEGLLFLGDNVLNGRLGQMTHGTFKGNIKAIDLALQSKAKWFVPGHGITGDRSILVAYQRYLTLIRNKVAELLDKGIADFEMKPAIRDILGDYASWVSFEDEFGRHISLAYLEVEEEMF
jgi:glyoxylase-like metal-dependent hydrolase (beta-lactamase superfamily II)